MVNDNKPISCREWCLQASGYQKEESTDRENVAGGGGALVGCAAALLKEAKNSEKEQHFFN